MAKNGSIRINLSVNSSDAKKELMDFEKYAGEVADFLKKMGKPMSVSVDAKQAEKQLIKLEQETEKLKDKYADFLIKPRATDFATKEENLQGQLARSEKGSNKESRLNSELNQLKADYADILNKSNQFEERIQNAIRALEVLNQYVQKLKENEKNAANAADNVSEKTKKTSKETNKSASSGSKFTRVLKTAATAAGGIAKGVGKIGKSLGGAVVKAAKNLASRFKGIGKSASDVRKKVLKIGLAMIGMRSVMAGFKQLVSSALSNNEKLQTQLTAVKGVMGEALAPAMNVIINALAQMVSFADKLYQVFTGVSLVAKYNAKQAKKQADATKENVKESEKLQMASFDVANALSDSSSSSSSSDSGSSDSDAAFLDTSSVSNWMQQIIDNVKASDWSGVGEAVAGKVVSALTGIDWEKMKQKGYTAGSNFANFVNGLFGYSDKDGNTLCISIGNTIGGSLNTVVDTIKGFAEKLKWTKVGTELANGISATVNSIDWDNIIETAGITGKGLAKLVLAFFTSKDKNGKTALTNITESAAKIMNSIIEFLNAMVTEFSKEQENGKTGWYNMGFSFMESLIRGILTIDWSKARDTVEKTAQGVSDLISGIFDILNAINPDTQNTYGHDLWDKVGKGIVAGILAGMLSVLALPFAKGAGTSFGDIFTAFYDGLCDVFGIHSPAKNMMPIGEYIIKGVFQGITNWLANIGTWLQENVFNKITNAWNTFKGLTVSIGATIQNGFDSAIAKWNALQAGSKDLKAKLKKEIEKGFDGAVKKWNNIKAKTKGLKAKFSAAFEEKSKKIVAKWDGLKEKSANFIANVKDGITSKMEGIINGIIDMLNGLIGGINKILTKFNKSWAVGTISHVKLARGGIVNNPGRGVQATIGEAGSEAVLPIQNHTEWMDEIAEKSANKVMEMFSGITLNNYMDGKQISREVVKITNRRQFARGGV